MEGDYTYIIHGTSVGVCSNELEGVAFALSKNFTRGLVPRNGPLHCNDKFE